MATPEQLERIVVMWKDSVPLQTEPTPQDWRREFEALCAKFPLPEDIDVEEVDCDGVPALWVSAPGVSSDRALIHYHSGGYVMGSAIGYREFAYRLSAAADARVLVPNYRLAPEHVYPAPLDDGVAAFRWLAKQEDPSRIVAVGDSAGGGMNLAVLLSLRDAGDTLPAAAVCISPLTDLAAEGESYSNFPDRDPVISAELAVGMGVVYMGEGKIPAETPLASPLYADLHGLPPLLVTVGDAEALYSDSTRLVDKVKAAGGDVELIVGKDLLHIYPLFASILPEGQEAIERIGQFVQSHTPARVR
jgi:monoterpene epsilon-lactone hydrolase